MTAVPYRPRRSALYVPADNPRALEKAASLACDMLILDLEDMVAPAAKTDARREAIAAATSGRFGAREILVRCNGLDTEWGQGDLVEAGKAGIAAILVPKICSPDDLALARGCFGHGGRLWAMIETCQAILQLGAIGREAEASGVDGWIIGSNDLAKEMRCPNDTPRLGLQAGLSMSVVAARAHGLSILDGIFGDTRDAEGLELQCAQAAALGFDGKTLVHPGQIAAANLAFTPDAASLTWARAVVAAFDAPENSEAAVVAVEGRYVERPHLDHARHIAAIADALAGSA